MKTSILIAAALVSSAVLSGACGQTARQSSITSVPAAANNSPITVQVTNEHPQDIDVFVMQGGERLRLGTVTTAETQQFTVPETATHGTGSLRLLVHPVGGGGNYSTGPVTVTPGDQVMLSVAPSLDQTSLSVSAR